MNKDCNVVRDLMPLCIDGAASEESQQMVTEHVAECSECATVYGEMQTALPAMSDEKSSTVLEHAAKVIHAKRKIRALWAIIMSMAALMIALVANAGTVAEFMDDVWFRLRYVGKNNEMRLDAFNVSLIHNEWGATYMEVESSPCGNRPFQPDFQVWYDERTGQGYLQLRLIATEEESERWNSSMEDFLEYKDVYGYLIHDISFDTRTQKMYYTTRYEEDGWWHYDSVEIYWIELVCGDDTEILWESGDGFPAVWNSGELTKSSEPAPTQAPVVTSYYVIQHSQTTPVPTKSGPTPTPTAPQLPPNKR